MNLTIDPTLKAWPAAAIRPRSNGFDTVTIRGDVRHLGRFVPLEPAQFVGVDCIIGGANLFRSANSNPGKSVFDNIQFSDSIDCRVSDCVFENVRWKNAPRQCIRFRFGACRNVVRYFRIERDWPFPSMADITAIQFVDGKNVDNVIEFGTVLNYTDQIQLTARANADGSYTNTVTPREPLFAEIN